MKIRHSKPLRSRLVLLSLLAAFGVTITAVGWYLRETDRVVEAEFDAEEISKRANSILEEISKITDCKLMDDWIKQREDAVEERLRIRGAKLKLNQRKSIEWAGANPVMKTPLSIVYVHGFSASRLELEPAINETASALGANAFYTRLTAHGISDGDDFADVRARDWAVDIEEALAIGRQIGERVVVIAMSTGAPLVLQNLLRETASAQSGKVAALVLLSPNYSVLARGSSLLAGPFANEIVTSVIGSHREFKASNEMHAERWTTRYRAEGLIAMARAVSSVQDANFTKLEIPVLTLFSAKDDVVDVSAIVKRAQEFKNPKSEIVEWPVARRHELVSRTFDFDHVAEFRFLLVAWIKQAQK